MMVVPNKIFQKVTEMKIRYQVVFVYFLPSIGEKYFVWNGYFNKSLFKNKICIGHIYHEKQFLRPNKYMDCFRFFCRKLVWFKIFWMQVAKIGILGAFLSAEILPKVLCKPHYGNSRLETVVCKWGAPIRWLYRVFFEKFVFKFPFIHKRFQMGQKMYFYELCKP